MAADTETYVMPKDGWVCFHCGERFTTPGSAEDHFGARPEDMAACRIKLGGQRGLVMELRKTQAALREALGGAPGLEVQERCAECGEPLNCRNCRHRQLVSYESP